MWISKKRFNELEKKVDTILQHQSTGNQQTPLSSMTCAIKEAVVSGLDKNRSAEIKVKLDGNAIYESIVSARGKTSTMKIDEQGIIIRTF
ncbi:hypothetical protein [Lachnoclostridium sp.]|uniref:hypothetical protein n=1 Tax=Lachnoclostridium sp. TaxID=2028282 RepID=UPI00289A422E|nr:hypothetical protein [Lachnoclostridium sp.]